MKEKEVKKHLGRAIYLVYYFHDRLYEEDIFETERWENLSYNTDREIWLNIYESLTIVLKGKEYLIDDINAPNLKIYSKEDVEFFLIKFRAFLEDFLEMKEL